jgi:pyroglutamyl-peptidase
MRGKPRLILSQLRLPFRHFGLNWYILTMKVSQSQVKRRTKLRNKKAKPLASRAYCIIAGFNAFGDEPFNPSQTIVETMPDHLEVNSGKEMVIIEKLVLPSCCRRAWSLLKRKLHQLPPSSVRAVVLTGLASGRNKITLERFALNIRDYLIEDINRHRPIAKMIDRNGPQAIRSKVPIEDLLKSVLKSGFPAVISNFCGTFVCNETYYRMLRFASLHNLSIPVLFAHVPLPHSFGKTLHKEGASKLKKLAKGKKNQLKAMQLAIIKIATFCCEPAK